MPPSWLERCLDLIRAAPVSVLVADAAWGAPYLFEALQEREELAIWLELNPEDATDDIAQGNALSSAVTRALGSQLFGHGLAYGYGLSVLRDNLELFTPLRFIVSGADYAQALVSELAGLAGAGARVSLSFQDLPETFLIPDGASVLQPQELQLQLEEAQALGENRLSDTELSNLHTLTKGAFEPFLIELNKRLNLPTQLRPGAVQAILPPSEAHTVPSAVMLQVYLRRGQHLDALELAARELLERVPALLAEGGEAFISRGLYGRLWKLLDGLPTNLKQEEAVLFWRLRAAARTGHLEHVRADVERHLARREAPDLRALHASKLGTPEVRLAEAKRAYEAKKTFYTLQHYGVHLLFHDPAAAFGIYGELLELTQRAEHLKHPERSVVAQAGQGLAAALLGRYRESSYRFEEALRAFDASGSGDWQLRASVLSNWAFSRILIGETVGLNELLQKEERAAREAFPALAFSYRETLGDYMLAQGRSGEALYYYQANLDVLFSNNVVQGADFPVNVARNVVQALLQDGQTDKAVALAERQYYLSKGSPDIQNQRAAVLGYGMALCVAGEPEAVSLLSEACDLFETSFQASVFTTASLYLTRALLDQGLEIQARAALGRAEPYMRELAEPGFKLLAGPERTFSEVYRMWQGKDAALKIRFLGIPEVTLYGKPIKLSPLQRDAVALLALEPQGIDFDSMMLKLYGERKVSRESLSTFITRLRERVPLTRAPYTFDVGFEADFTEVERHLRKGELRAALERYRGPLLPRSEVERIVEAREVLEEALRQATLDSGDGEALLGLSENLRDDLELWEATLETLPRQDPRYAIASAKHKRVVQMWGL